VSARLRRAIGRQHALGGVVFLGSAQIFGRACEAATAGMPHRLLRQSDAFAPTLRSDAGFRHPRLAEAGALRRNLRIV
jgi:hypothetical protein